MRALALLLALVAAFAGAARADTPAAPAKAAAKAPTPARTLCDAIQSAAKRNGLPYPFFTRLIWQESRFDPAAVSPAGAQGVAQFMPGTAAERGLADPFEATRALDESAAYLKELREKFGNIGLAAAAYNAGPGRIGRWLAGHASLPGETVGYVEIVTGHAAFEWRGPFSAAARPPELSPEPGFSCVAFAGDAGRRRTPFVPDDLGGPPPKRWSVILVASYNKAAMLAEWQLQRARYAETLGTLTPSIRRRHLGGLPAKKYVVQIENDDRNAANKLCNALHGDGGNCVVLRNMLR